MWTQKCALIKPNNWNDSYLPASTIVGKWIDEFSPTISGMCAPLPTNMAKNVLNLPSASASTTTIHSPLHRESHPVLNDEKVNLWFFFAFLFYKTVSNV